MPAKLFAKSVVATGGSLKPGVIESIRSGKSKFLTNNDGSDVSWQVYVPPSYDGRLPFGLLAYVNSGDSGDIVGGWSAVLDKHRLIWCGANQSGNSQLVGRSITVALFGEIL